MNKKLPVLISIPHSSLFVPKNLLKDILITEFDFKNHADIYTDKIFHVPCAHEAKATITRLLADVNRAPDDIQYECQLCIDGVVVKTTPDGKGIYKNSNLQFSHIKLLLEKYHSPYHKKLDQIIKKEKIKFLIDGHSMWSRGPSHLKDSGSPRADIVLGNRDYTTCDRSMTQFIQKFFEKQGYSVKINDPYSGKFVLGNHCHRNKLPGIQIEVNRKLFLSERSLEPKLQSIQKINQQIQELVQDINDLL